MRNEIRHVASRDEYRERGWRLTLCRNLPLTSPLFANAKVRGLRVINDSSSFFARNQKDSKRQIRTMIEEEVMMEFEEI